ncbi:MAG TPA: ATP-binding protein [Candidatus Binatia bacterium]
MKESTPLRRAIEVLQKQIGTLQDGAGGQVEPALNPIVQELSNCLAEIESAEDELSRQYATLGKSTALLNQEHTRYRDLFEFSPDGYLVTDPKGVIQAANVMAARLFNVGLAHLIGKPIVLFLGNAAVRNVLEQSRATAMQNRTEIRTWESQVRPRSGEPFDAMIRSSVIFDARGKEVGLRMLIRDVSDAKRREAELNASQEQLRALAARLQEIREEERNNLARELHDEFGAALTTLKLDLVWLKKRVPEDSPEVHERIAAMSKLIEITTQGIRQTATMLRPRLLDDFGLVAAIEWQVQDFQTRSGIGCDLTTEEVDLPVECGTSVFRILQECLTNVARHAEAASVEIRLQKSDGDVVLRVHDDGKGFPLQSQSQATSLGLVGMRERAYALGGTFEMESAPGHGTTVTVRIPCSRNGAESAQEAKEQRAKSLIPLKGKWEKFWLFRT